MVNSEWKNLDHLVCLNVSFLFAPHCQCRDVGQDMKQTYISISGVPYPYISNSMGWMPSTKSQNFELFCEKTLFI